MRNYGRTTPGFWTGQTGRAIKKLGAQAQVLAHYLFTSPHCNMACLYHVALPTVAHETGVPLDQITRLFGEFARLGFAHYDDDNEIVWVVNGAHYQIAESLKPGDKRIQHIGKQLYFCQQSPLVESFVRKYGNAYLLETVGFAPSTLDAPSHALSDAPRNAPSQPPCEAPCQGASQASSSSSSSEQEQGAVAESSKQDQGTANRGSERRRSAAHSDPPQDVSAVWAEISATVKRISPLEYQQAISQCSPLDIRGRVLYLFSPPQERVLSQVINQCARNLGLDRVEILAGR